MSDVEQSGDLTCLCRGCKKEFYVRFDSETFDKLPPQTANLEIRYCLSGGIYAISVECPHCKHDHYW